MAVILPIQIREFGVFRKPLHPNWPIWVWNRHSSGVVPAPGACRGVIGGDAANSNQGKKGISELASFQLAGLGPGPFYKPGVKKADDTQALYPNPPVPPETQDLVCRVFKVAIGPQMTESREVIGPNQTNSNKGNNDFSE